MKSAILSNFALLLWTTTVLCGPAEDAKYTADVVRGCRLISQGQMGKTQLDAFKSGTCAGIIGTLAIIGSTLHPNIRNCAPKGLTTEQALKPERVVGFFNTYRQLYPVSRNVLRGIADQFQMRKSMTRSALNSIASTTASSMISMRSSSRWPQSRMTTLENENKIPTTHGLMDVQWQNEAKLINLFKSVAPLAIARRHCAADFGSWRLTQSAGW